MEPFPGYRLRQLLGRGGFAEVWEAESAKGGTVALKFLPCSDSLAASKEIRSIQGIRKLEHPNLIHIEQVWTHLGYIVIAMELADGSLLDLLEAYMEEFGTPIPAEQVCIYLGQAADGLDFLNSRIHEMDGRTDKVSFQHCDIKPSNLLLFDDIIKVADFGLSSPSSAVVKFHRRAGTPDFTSPEVFQGRLSDWTDQYSLGVTYIQLRTGKLPWKETPSGIQRNYVRPPPDLTIVPQNERAVLARALAPAPQNRWPNCVTFINELSKAVLAST